MKLLFIHSDFLEYHVTEAVKKIAEEITEEHRSGRMEESLVVFTAVEKGDRDNLEELVTRVDSEVRKTADVLKVKDIVLYPYAHLSSNLAPAREAVPVIKAIEEKLKETDLNVMRSPFGWYKAFTLSAKGHPMSELSREISFGESCGEKQEVSEAVKAEEKAESSWFILDEDGELHTIRIDKNKVKGFDFKEHTGLRDLCRYEIAKSRVSKGDPPHVALMQRQELVDYEPASDPGHFRYYPKGKLIKSLIENYVSEWVRKTGGMEVETPIMYDYEHPSLKKYLHRFPARQYAIQTPNKRVFLRFAACFGQFLIMHDATISYKHLPIRLYELTRYSFRVEQRGELAGLRRLRAFTMPDCHSFCGDMAMAKEEAVDRFRLSKDIIDGIQNGLPDDLEFAIRVTKDFYDQNKDFLVSLVKEWGRPALVEMWEDRFFYFVFKYEWNFIDALGKASALNTDQIDVENAERYGITYVDSNGEEQYPLILHQSPSGAIERVMYALLERIHKEERKGNKPEFPLWLSPTQVRFIPLNSNYTDACVEMARILQARADVDDRDDKMGRKIRDAEREWVNYIIVYGEKEAASGVLPIRTRTGESMTMTLEELGAHIGEKTKGYPYLGLPLNMLISKRLKFRG